MSKSTHFFGHLYSGQLIKSLKRDKILELNRKCSGERYVKSFDGWHHLVSKHIECAEPPPMVTLFA